MAIGAVLKQKLPDRGEVTVKFASRLLRQAEKNYSTTDNKGLALVYAVEQFRQYLFNEFEIRTDHKPLCYLMKIKSPEGRIARWISFLSSFKFKIIYIKGTENGMADMLSRIEVNQIEEESKNTNREDDRKALIREVHEICGHANPTITYEFFKKNYDDHPSLKTISEEIRRCRKCIFFNRKHYAHEIMPMVREGPFDMIGIDIMGPLRRSSNGNRYILLATDYSTRWVEGQAMKKKSAAGVAKFLEKFIFTRHGPRKK